MNDWVNKQHSLKAVSQLSEPDLRVRLNPNDEVQAVCLEDHRLLIDKAIDKLKGELIEKEKYVIEPLLYRQKAFIEDQQQKRIKLEQKIEQLQHMVLMQEQTIRILLNVN